MSALTRHHSGIERPVSTRSKALSRRGVPRSFRARPPTWSTPPSRAALLHSLLVADEDDLDVGPSARQLSIAFRWMSPMWPLKRLGDCEECQHREPSPSEAGTSSR